MDAEKKQKMRMMRENCPYLIKKVADRRVDLIKC